MTGQNLPLFFLGANAPGGFVSRFDSAYDPLGGWRTYIIKGGPGTGKSSMMKRIAAAAASHGGYVELIPCSSDPQSLDGVILPQIKVCLLDGTSPHVVEPKYPGVCEVIINLGDHYDSDKLMQNAPRILPVCRDNASLHSRASRYISAAGSLISDNYRIALDCTDTLKAAKFGASLAGRELPRKKGGPGAESVRFLSAVTPTGQIFYRRTLELLCDRMFIVDDEYGAASRVIMSAVRLSALELGYDIISCPCPFAPNEKIEHIIVPEMRLGFCTSNRYLPAGEALRKIHARRFTDSAALRQRKQRLSFNRKAIRELIIAASDTLAQAKAVHDQIENFYISAMDFSAVDKRIDALSAEITAKLDAAQL